MPTEAWPVLNEMAEGQQIPAGLHCIIQLFWSRAPALSELAAAIELLLPPICTQCIERLLQPCPQCLSSILLWPTGHKSIINKSALNQTIQITYIMLTYGQSKHLRNIYHHGQRQSVQSVALTMIFIYLKFTSPMFA